MDYNKVAKEIDAEFESLYIFDKEVSEKIFDDAEVMFQKAKNIKYEDGMAKALTVKGLYKLRNDDFSEALSYYLESLRISKSTGNYLFQARNLNSISRIFLLQRLYSNALFYQLETVDIIEQKMIKNTKNEYYLRVVQNNIGMSLYNLKEYKEAEKFYLMALKMKVTNDNSRYNYIQIIGNLILLNIKINNSIKIEEYYTQLINNSKDCVEPLSQYIVETYKAQYECYRGNLKKAHDIFTKAFNHSVANFSSFKDGEMLKNWFDMLVQNKMYDELSELSATIKKQIKEDDIAMQMELAKYSYHVEKYKGNIEKALAYLEKSSQLESEFNDLCQKLIVNNLIVIAKMHESNEELYDSFDKDSLTTCYNRHILDKLNENMSDITFDNSGFTLIMIDIDNFKQYNDNYGHIKGDDVLKNIANSLRSVLSEKHSYLIRYGGDEFIVILSGFYSKTQAIEICKIMKNAIKKTNIVHEFSNVSDRISLTFGMKYFKSKDIVDISTCIYAADIELYKGKHNGRDCIYLDGKKIY